MKSGMSQTFRKNSTDEHAALRYIPSMAQTAFRPIILKGRNPSRQRAIQKAVDELAALRKTDPAAYRAFLKKHAHREVRIVQG